MKFNLKVFLLVTIGLLVVGVLATKITVEAIVALDETDQECVDANWSVLYDNPLEQLMIGGLGDTVVIKKDNDILHTKSYTLFRIPVGEAVFQCPDGASFKVPQSEAKIQQAIEEAKYCEVKSDCVPVESKCPFGCYAFVNEAEAWRIQTFIDSYESNCIYSCVAISGFDCVNNRCETVLDTGSSEPQFVYGLGTYYDLPVIDGLKSFQSDRYGLSFDYPEYYLLFEGEGGGLSDREYYTVTLHQDNEMIRETIAGNIPEATEWPPAIHLSLYLEPNLEESIEDWVRTNSLESNYHPGMVIGSGLEHTTVANRPAVAYQVDGLYLMEVVVFSYDEWVVVASVDSLSREGDIQAENFADILKSIEISH